jgi:N6-L-threonylcarbamoyladenine synthase
MEKLILAIDTSCDETSAAVVCGRKVLSNVISSQINIHKKYGGVFPALAKRAHQEKIEYVVNEAIKRASSVLNSKFKVRSAKTELNSKHDPPAGGRNPKQSMRNSNTLNSKRFKNCDLEFVSDFDIRISDLPLSAIAVTQGPGLAIALEVGIKKAKEIIRNSQSVNPQLKLIAVNHLEGHLLSCLAQNINGKPKIDLLFPALGLIVSGGHTELVLVENIGKYKVIGSTLDDACGEALDKGARILKLGYPGGPIIERLAEKGFPDKYSFSKTLNMRNNLQFSYSGIKTQLLYLVQNIPKKEFAENINNLAFSFQEACFEQIIRKTINAIKIYQPKNIICGGGVMANKHLRKLLRKTANNFSVNIYFPQNKKLITDNAGMIGVAAYFKLMRNEVLENIDCLDREPRLKL